MGYCEITDDLDREVRHCKTRAFGARVFSNLARSPCDSDMWTEIARSWEHLAQLKEANEQTMRLATRLHSRLMADRALIEARDDNPKTSGPVPAH